MSGVVVLRPEPGASATAAAARAAGFSPLVVPLFAIRPCAWEAPGALAFDAVMMTSANAARHGGPALADYRMLPLYTVGAATAAAARAAGFETVIEAGPDVATLAARLRAGRHRTILDLGGRERTPFDPGPLQIVRRELYASQEIAVDAGQLGEAARQGAVMLLHSARAAARLAALLSPQELRVAAISAGAAGDHPWAATEIAALPNDAALLAAAARLCDHASQVDGNEE